MALFTIADLHLSFGTNKPMDVFPGWKDYTTKLAHNWNRIVREEDTIVIAGDISWALKLEETREDFSFLQSLPGRKVLLKGNHDYWWSTKKKMEEFLASSGFSSLSILHNCAIACGEYALCGTRGWFYDAEKDEDKKILNREVGRLNTSIDAAEALGLEPIVFLHYPPVYGNAECREIFGVLENRGIHRCYYGHIHGGNAAKRAVVGEYRGVTLSLVACDYAGFCPVLVR